MKLPKFFRSLMYFSIPVFVISIVILFILAGVFGEDWSALETTVVNIVTGVVAVSFVTMTGSIILDPLVRVTENALLRRFGVSTTATVLESYYVESGTNKGRKLHSAVRIRLDVRNPNGDPFKAVAEDSVSVGVRINNGQVVPVKFDPRTREVALDLPKQPKTKKRYDF